MSKTEFVKQASRFTDTIGDAAKQAADSEAFKKVATGLDSLAKGSGAPPSTLYRPPSTENIFLLYYSIQSTLFFKLGLEVKLKWFIIDISLKWDRPDTTVA